MEIANHLFLYSQLYIYTDGILRYALHNTILLHIFKYMLEAAVHFILKVDFIFSVKILYVTFFGFNAFLLVPYYPLLNCFASLFFLNVVSFPILSISDLLSKFS